GSSDDGKLFQALALHISEPGMHSKLTHFFETIHGLACQGFDIIVENKCSKAEIQQASNLLVIYTEGYDLLKPYIGIEKDAPAQQLTTILGHVLKLNTNV
ncbi:MAG: hypothetical protein GY694_20750, partial [Gammaproteobacteria bacterium]|nr:hypothetical protein [Gammaproteobacteria bacterium]